MTLRFQRTLAAGLLVLLMTLAAAANAMPASTRVPGGVVVLRIASDAAPAPKARFQGRRVLVTWHDDAWHAVVGIPLATKPGRHRVRVEVGKRERDLAFDIAPKHYPAQKLTIPDRRMVEPLDEDLERIRREHEIMNRVRSHWREVDRVDLDLILPADGPLSSRFGLRRILNDQPRSPHSGLDLAVPPGTPIHAAAAGMVVATGDFFFAGKTVCVDHGQGLITMYSHLDEIAVREGDRLARGARLGRSGMSGRVTGPHLHWSVYLNGAVVDPEPFLKTFQSE